MYDSVNDIYLTSCKKKNFRTCNKSFRMKKPSSNWIIDYILNFCIVKKYNRIGKYTDLLFNI